MKKIVVFTGAGVSKESGIDTFRDKGGLWDKFSVEEVATPGGWMLDRKKVLGFYNTRRKELKKVKPNKAHMLISSLEPAYDVTVITQNFDNLHERAGSCKVMHLHGELTKAKIEDRDIKNPESIEIGYNSIKLGDTPAKYGREVNPSLMNQLRPDIVWFGENVPMLEKAGQEIFEADILLVIGTSLQVYPAAGLLEYANDNADIFIIDPEVNVNTSRKMHVIEKTATEGMPIFVNYLKENYGK